MSVVAARVYEDRIEVAADTICIRGGDKLKDAEKSHTKLFRYKDLVVGGVGISSEIGLIQRYMKSHIIKEMTEDCIFDFFVEFSKWKNDLTSDKDIENSYLLASQENVVVVYRPAPKLDTDYEFERHERNED